MTNPERVSAPRKAAERRGRRSETLAALFLRMKGYRIVARRVRNRAGEIDLIARSPRGIVCFVEVKARRNADEAAMAVMRRQRARITRAAQLYLASRPALAEADVRFDIVTVAPGALPRHVRDAWRAGDLFR